jgi:hypothetical protein
MAFLFRALLILPVQRDSTLRDGPVPRHRLAFLQLHLSPAEHYRSVQHHFSTVRQSNVGLHGYHDLAVFQPHHLAAAHHDSGRIVGACYIGVHAATRFRDWNVTGDR